MTTKNEDMCCPAEMLIKQLSGKWKPEIFLHASKGNIRFSQLLRLLKGSNKQIITTALREMEEMGFLERRIIKLKPLHVEYCLTLKGKKLIPLFQSIESFAK